MKENKKEIFDVLIIGLGPAGLTASIYASRYRLKNIMLGAKLGGEISLAHKVENYPGVISIKGLELAQKMADQVKNLGADLKLTTVGRIEIQKEENLFHVFTEDKQEFFSKTLLVASGTERRKLNIPNENSYLGRGVSYCTNCDAPFFKNKTVAVIGGGDSAITGALHLTEYASKIYLIYRREKEKMRAEPIWIEQIEKDSKTTCIFQTNITEIIGDGVKVTGVKLDKPYQGKNVLPVDGVFIEIGAVPVGKLVESLGVELDESGYIKVNPDMSTNISGIYAAGDVTANAKVLQQMITACAQGAIAASSVFKHLKHKSAPLQWG